MEIPLDSAINPKIIPEWTRHLKVAANERAQTLANNDDDLPERNYSGYDDSNNGSYGYNNDDNRDELIILIWYE